MSPLALWKPLAALALVVTIALLWARGNDYRRQAELWRTATAKYEQANKDATRWAEAERAAKDAAAKHIKETANASLKPSLDAGARTAGDYAAHNRCVRVEASEGRGVGADMSRPASPAGQPEIARGAPDVAVSERDLAVCTSATLRLENAIQWAAEAKGAGLAN